jgi:bacillopeptidase F
VLERLGPDDAVSVIVRFAGEPELRRREGETQSSRRVRLVQELKTATASDRRAVEPVLRDPSVTRRIELWAIHGLALTAGPDVIRDLATDPRVTRISLDGVVAAPRSLAADAAAPEWNLEMVRVPELWASGHTGEGVVVAVVDSGVDALHPDLEARWRGGSNSWFDASGEHTAPYDADGHGTQVAGLIVGGDAGGTAVGVAPGARWIAAKIFDDSGSGTLSGIHSALQWLLDPDGNPSTDDAPDVVNASWGFPEQAGECLDEFARDVEVLRAAGIAVVFSGGNTGPGAGTSISPGNNVGAIPVGGVDDGGSVLPTSARGPGACDGGIYPALVAPGASVRTTDLTFGGVVPEAYATVTGTSFAAPHVSGAFALLLAAHPAATVDQLEEALLDGAEDVEDDGPDDDSGWGVLDVARAKTVLADLVAGAGVTVFTSAEEYLTAVTSNETLTEGFEDDTAWGAVRSPDSAPNVTSSWLTWTSNHTANEVTTGGGPAYTGDWAFYSDPHGDLSVTNPSDPIADGFVGTSERSLIGVGAWFKATNGSRLSIILDGNEAARVDLGPVDAVHRFYGIVVDGSFTSFEFRETEGTLGDQKLLFVDDVTVAFAAGGNSAPDATIVWPSADVTVAEGESVEFEGVATDPDGDAVTVVWNFGDGSTSTALVPGSHRYPTAGVYIVTLTATDAHGLSDPSPATRTVTVTAAPPPPTDGVVAGVADVRGAQGSDWHTDLYLHNASATPIDVELFFSPADGRAGQPATVSVDPGFTEDLADVVSQTFGTTGSGAVLWRVTSGDPDALLVSANTFNRLDDVGVYGQQVPGVRWRDAAPAGTPVMVPALAGAFRTNLGFAVDADCTEVVVRAYDRSGVLQVERTYPVEPLSWTQLNRVFRREFPGLIANPDAVATDDSLHRFEVVGVDGRVVGYTSVIDNLTNDGAYLVGRWAGDAVGRQWLPGVAFLRGANSSQWRSDVVVMNLSDAPDTATFTYLPSAADNSGVLVTRSVALTDGEAAFEGNVLRELFGMFPPAVGTLALDAAQSVAWMRTYTEEVVDLDLRTFGQAIPALSDRDTVTAGGEGRVFGFTSDDRTRSNMILQNTFADANGTLLPATVDVEVLDRRGLAVHRQSYTLQAGEYLQHNGFLSDYGVGWITGAALRLIVTDAPSEAVGGGVAVMVSEVNGASLPGTNDGRLLTGTVFQAPPPP